MRRTTVTSSFKGIVLMLDSFVAAGRPCQRGACVAATCSRALAAAPRARRVALEAADHLARRDRPHAVLILAGERDRLRERATRRHEPIRDPHAQRLLARDAPAGQDQVEGVAVAEEAREPDRPAVHERNPPTTAEDAEHRVLRGDAQIAPSGELEPAGDRVPLYGGDDRLPE